MAISRCIFNTQTLSILNMLDPDETIQYDWTINDDFSTVVLEGSIQFNNETIVSAVNEHRVQPNISLTATGIGPGRCYFISLFRIDNDHVADQIVTEANKIRMRTFAPSWYDQGAPTNPDTTWGSSFTSGHYILTKDIINNQISTSEWD